MTASLADQLRSIKKASRAIVDKRALQTGHSLCFPPEEAAEQDLDTVFDYCVNGFIELCTVEPRLDVFERTLFSPKSKSVNRYLQTKDENDELDLLIERCVILLTPHFLHYSAVKVLEWLVRRFSIHIENADLLLTIFLPYHEHNEYRLLLSIVPLASLSRWSFWSEYSARNNKTQTLFPPSQYKLVRALAKNRNLCEHVLQTAQRIVECKVLSQTWFKFLKTVSEAIIRLMKQSPGEEEAIAERFVPFAASGIRMTEFPDYQRTCCSVFIALARARVLNDKVAAATLLTLPRYSSLQVSLSFVTTIVEILETSSLSQIPGEVTDYLSKHVDNTLQVADYPTYTKMLNGLHQKCNGIINLNHENAKTDPISASTERIESEITTNGKRKWTGGHKRPLPSLESLPNALNEPSFLMTKLDADHELVFSYGLDVARSGSNALAKFLSHSLFALNKTIPFTLLLRMATSVDNQISVRVSSLEAIETYLITLNEDYPNKLFDCQACVPYLLCCLADPSEMIRHAAAQIIKFLANYYDSEDGKPPSVTIEVIGFADFHGNGRATDELLWLTWSEARWFMTEQLLPYFEQCIADSQYIYSQISATLQDAGRRGKTFVAPRAVFSYLISYTLHTPLSSVHLFLLKTLNRLNDAFEMTAINKTQQLLPLLTGSKSPSWPSFESSILYTRELVAIICPKYHDLEPLIHILKSGQGHMLESVADRLVELWPDLIEDRTYTVIQHALDITVHGDTANGKAAQSFLSRITVSSKLFVSLLSDINISPSSGVQAATPNSNPEDSASSLSSIQKLTVLIETLEVDSGDCASVLLDPLLVSLSYIMKAETSSGISLNFLKQLLLSQLLAIVDKYKSSLAKDVPALRVDVLIDCIRTSNSIQVHNRAFLVVSALAEIASDTVLHSIMPIFTFMGSHVLQQDDAFSVRVLERALKSIIPPLVKSKESQKDKNIPVDVALLKTFVGNYQYIPIHRRLVLFSTLLETININRTPALLLVLLTERLVTSKNYKKDKKELDLAFDLNISILQSLQSAMLLNTLTTLLCFAMNCNQSNENLAIPLSWLSTTFESDDFMLIQIRRHLVLLVNMAMKKLIPFHQKRYPDNWNACEHQLVCLSKLLLEMTSVVSFPRPIHTAATLTLGTSLQYLPLQLLAEFLAECLMTDNANTIITTIEIIVRQLTRGSISEANKTNAISGIVPEIVKMIESGQSDNITICAYNSIARLSVEYGKANASSFVLVVPYAINHLSIVNGNLKIGIASMECLTALLPTLKVKMILHLPEMMEATFKCEKYVFADPAGNYDDFEYALWNLYRMLSKTMSKFIRTYCKRMICSILRFSTLYGSRKPDIVSQSHKDMIAIMTKRIDSYSLLEACMALYDDAKQLNGNAFIQLYIIMDEVLARTPREYVAALSADLFDFFLQALELRCDSKLSATMKDKMENCLMNVVVKFAEKLNEVTFKPLFEKLYDWAFELVDQIDTFNTTDDERHGGLTIDTREDRIRIFYKLFNALAGPLKFVLTANYDILFDQTITILNEYRAEIRKSSGLWFSVLSSLQKSFIYDETSYWQTSTRFRHILPLLLDQFKLANSFNAKGKLIPAICGLMGTTSSEQNQKDIHLGILKHLRSESVATRLAALAALSSLYTHSGDVMLSMLPQAIPFIAEAMEDENEKVVRETQILISKIEKDHLGESMQKYLIN